MTVPACAKECSSYVLYTVAKAILLLVALLSHLVVLLLTLFLTLCRIVLLRKVNFLHLALNSAFVSQLNTSGKIMSPSTNMKEFDN